MTPKKVFDDWEMKWVFVNKIPRTKLPLPKRRAVVYRDDFTCQRCKIKAPIRDMKEHHDWFRSPMGRGLQLNAFYLVREMILSYPFVKVLRYENPYEESTDVIFEYISSEGFEVDHIIPVRQGGTDEMENLQLLCRECHVEKTKNERWGYAMHFCTGNNTMFRYEDVLPKEVDV